MAYHGQNIISIFKRKEYGFHHLAKSTEVSDPFKGIVVACVPIFNLNLHFIAEKLFQIATSQIKGYIDSLQSISDRRIDI